MVETMKKLVSFLCVGLLGGCCSLGYFYYQSQIADFQIKDIQGNRDVWKDIEVSYIYPKQQSYLKGDVKNTNVTTKIVKESPSYDVLNQRLYDDILSVYEDRIGKETSNPWEPVDMYTAGTNVYQQKIDEAQLVYYLNVSGKKTIKIQTDIVEHSDDRLHLYLRKEDGLENQVDAVTDYKSTPTLLETCVAIPMSDGAYYFMPEITDSRTGQNYIYQIKDDKVEKFMKLPQRKDAVLLRNKDLLIAVSYDKPYWYFTGYDLKGHKQYDIKIETIENLEYRDLPIMYISQNDSYSQITIDKKVYVIDADRGKIVDSFQNELSHIQDMYYKDGKLYLLGTYISFDEKKAEARLYVYDKNNLLYMGNLYEWELYKNDGGGYTYNQSLGFRMNFKR